MANKKEAQDDTSLKTIFIVLLILIGCYCGGYFIGIRLIPARSKDTKTVISNSNKEIDYKVTDEKIVHLMERLMVGFDCWNIETYANDKTITPKELSNDKIFEVVSLSSYSPKNVNSFSLDEFIEESKKYFKDEFEFNPEKINYSGKNCLPYKYDLNDKIFKKQETACGGNCGPNRSQYKIISAIEKSNVLRIGVKVLFGSQAEDVKFYSDYERKNFVTDDYEKLDDYLEKGDSYLFTFEKADGYFVFVSSEKM